MSRSLKVSPENIQEVKSAFSRSPFTSQQALATELGLARDTIRKFLSGIPIDRLNFQEICDKLGLDWQSILPRTDDTSESSIPPDFYVQRPPIESDCCQAIVQSGALLRIKAPQQMGKTCLMRKVLQHARKQGYKTVVLDIQQASSDNFSDLRKFLRWFCTTVGDELNLPGQLENYWHGSSPNYNTTKYFKNYLLGNITSNLVLALDNVDLVFEKAQLAPDFCGLLRSLNQKAESGDVVFQKLRLVIVHSTDVYSSINITQSPLANVGVTVELKPFNWQQVCDLAKLYQLSWDNTQLRELINMVGGHPYLVKEAFDKIARQRLTFDELLQTAYTEAGIYGDYLRGYLLKLNHNAELREAMKKVVAVNSPVRLEVTHRFQLHRMGLVHLQGNDVKISCNLYRKYFCDCLEVTDCDCFGVSQ
ncbi:MAG: hypothetical protein F6K58_05325 [Symploca sp. SIO2E9]|nr:hypothetical protein [Symploca sp. SIO2E9]